MLYKYCANIVQIFCNIVGVLFKYCTNIEQISNNSWANVVQLLFKYCKKNCVNIVQNIMQILLIYCENIVNRLGKYFNAVQILYKYLQTLFKYCT